MILGRGQGIGFAIPADIAQHVAQQLLTHGRVRRAWIGVGFQELTPELAADFGVTDRRGALVNEIVPGGPAARAGLEPGDVVVAVDGVPVREGRDLLRQVLRRPVGAEVRLDVVRDGRLRSFTVTTAERPEANTADDAPGPGGDGPRPSGDERGLGVQLVPVTPAIARQLGRTRLEGAIVAEVRPGSPADRAGLRRGDVIVEADRQAVRGPADVLRAFSDGRALLRVERGERGFYTVLRRE
jgi:serine protease Do